MTDHKIGTREQWLAARKALLAREKEHTRRGDELARERRELPWVRVEKQYAFDAEDGAKTLEELQAYRRRMGWTFPWVSSNSTNFNYDYAASATPEELREGGEYNFESFGDRTP